MNDRVTVVGTYADFAAFIDALAKLRAKGYRKELTAYSPVPRHEIDEALPEGPSEVRYFTLFGSLLGLASGALLTIWTSLKWGIITGGKPVISIPPFIIIMFELTVLLGGAFTLLGFLVRGKIPFLKTPAEYDVSFSEDTFAIAIGCSRKDAETIASALRDLHAAEVKVE